MVRATLKYRFLPSAFSPINGQPPQDKPMTIPLRHHALKLALATAFAASALTLFAQAPQGNSNASYADVAQRAGISKCAARINQVSSFVTGSNPNSGQLLTGAPDRVNKDIVATAIEVESSGITSLVSSSFAPGAGTSECSATYDAITYWNASCAMVATSNYGAYKLTQPLMRSVYVLDGGPTVKVFLMPAGSGCVSVKKEMVY